VHITTIAHITRTVIDEVVEMTTFKKCNPKVSWPLYYIALYDFLFGKGVQGILSSSFDSGIG
jgi:hypothetical protein